MKKYVLIGLALSALVSSGAKAENGNGIGTGEVNESETAALDTVVSRRFMTDEVVIENDPKTLGSLRHQALSYSEIGGANLRNVQINSLKTASQFVPNLFIPDYGSRLTSAIYIRGIGSRVNTPAVGLYVDDVAYKEKSAFDIAFNDVSRIEVLRGPQSTLYGSNTMGGLIQVYSHSPLEVFQFGRQTVINLGGSTKDVGRYVNFRTMHPMGNSAAFSVSGFYQGRDGYNTNTFLNRSSNGGNEGGGKFRLVYNPASDRRFLLDFKTSLEYSDENGYDYYNVKDHKIVENELGSYRRTLMNTSLKLKYDFAHSTLTSVSAYQFITDKMFMDQDFSSANIFTLQQKQKSHNLSEELALKGSWSNIGLDYVVGGFVSKQWLKTNAPVVFGKDGIQQFIQSGIDKGFEAANKAMNPMGMSLGLVIDDDAMEVPGLFDTPMFNTAAFGQLTKRDLFIKGLDLTAGVRVDYEHTKMDYDTYATSNFTFHMNHGPRMTINKPFSSTSAYVGTLKNDYTQVLPKAALSYRINSDAMVYASASKGFRSGGFNFQMFSDLIQSAMRNDMMSELAKDPQLGARMANYMKIGENPSADSTTVFKPETSWNFELGTHLTLFDGHLNANAAVFYIKAKDQQLTRFAAASGFGRQTVNAGESESYGAEVELQGWFRLFSNPLSWHGSYGYTHAKFTDYDAGISNGVSHNYTDNYVPFSPLHNFSLAADYSLPLSASSSCASRLFFGANLTGQGKTYWTEDNTASEPFYMLLGAHAGVQLGDMTINIWGKNLTDKSYVPFYFVSMSNGFAQTCRPRQFGIDLTYQF